MEENNKKGIEQLVEKWKKYLIHMKKETILIVFLMGIILLVIAMPTKKKQDTDSAITDKVSNVGENRNRNVTYQEEIEKELAHILSYINGVGEAKVMVTLTDGGTSVVEKDCVINEEGHANESKTYRSEEKSVYEENEQGETPFVISYKTPQVGGVLVVCEGGEDPKVKKEILEAIMALFPIESHKISIVGAKKSERSS